MTLQVQDRPAIGGPGEAEELEAVIRQARRRARRRRAFWLVAAVVAAALIVSASAVFNGGSPQPVLESSEDSVRVPSDDPSDFPWRTTFATDQIIGPNGPRALSEPGLTLSLVRGAEAPYPYAGWKAGCNSNGARIVDVGRGRVELRRYVTSLVKCRPRENNERLVAQFLLDDPSWTYDGELLTLRSGRRSFVLEETAPSKVLR